MGRLVDIDEVIKVAENTFPQEDVRKIMWVLCHTPTAYDISKVVGELETLRIDKSNYFGVLNIVAEKYDRANEMLDDAIEIVKELAEEYINTSTDISTNKSTEQPTWQQQTMNRFERVE